MSGCYNIAFFNSIRDYFGFEEHAAFWDRVLFFNFVPTIVGGGEQRYRWATEPQAQAGRARVLRILEAERPQKLFVFTTKGWRSFPMTIEDMTEHPGHEPHGWQTYRLTDGTEIIAVGLRHPQFAAKAVMTAAVKAVLALPHTNK